MIDIYDSGSASSKSLVYVRRYMTRYGDLTNVLKLSFGGTEESTQGCCGTSGAPFGARIQGACGSGGRVAKEHLLSATIPVVVLLSRCDATISFAINRHMNEQKVSTESTMFGPKELPGTLPRKVYSKVYSPKRLFAQMDEKRLKDRKTPMEDAILIYDGYKSNQYSLTLVIALLTQLYEEDPHHAVKVAKALVDDVKMTDWLGFAYLMTYADAFMMALFEDGDIGLYRSPRLARACRTRNLDHIQRVLAYKPKDVPQAHPGHHSARDFEEPREKSVSDPLRLSNLDMCPQSMDYDICKALIEYRIDSVVDLRDLSKRFIVQLARHYAPHDLRQIWCLTLPTYERVLNGIERRRIRVASEILHMRILQSVLCDIIASYGDRQ